MLLHDKGQDYKFRFLMLSIMTCTQEASDFIVLMTMVIMLILIILPSISNTACLFQIVEVNLLFKMVSLLFVILKVVIGYLKMNFSLL